ncbi:hypothetical protein VOLCADRAFT_103091 [Volvox carteri f. nagariensis]|uniref:SAP domain-containing protein n=1 Tax=Volvox carteri f. nagariensis TaxID=3068 RepID=D8TKL2_VOLCA|nr:uncharacterized protein VOLCADRAFT_103091 [Volvox carteri f. nagariensis]EFJ52083.1 hypothetical protein VOLCADRAFT_103091 [Volvox carteri f. nagariensis]|eukprot:XP_002946857.1 hypothetical protein VOLCADRAFT_103091 [Volvox carteri f. nagariensis]
MVTLEEVDKLKVNELKAACKELGLEQTGNKADLVARLKAALSQQQAGGQETVGDGVAPATIALANKDGKHDAAATAAVEPNTVEATGPEAPSVPTAAAGTAAAGSEKSRARIAFSDSEAAKFEALKVQVVNTAPVEKPKQMTEAEKIRLRKERFKDPDMERKKQRAQRFNLIDADLEKEKMMKRAERFGTKHPELEQIKKEQRAARFGIVDEETKKKQRLEKFKPLSNPAKANFNLSVKQDDDFEAKRQARAARFAAAE